MKRAIIVGSSGQDGRILFDRLSEAGYLVLGIERRTLRSAQQLPFQTINILSENEVEAVIEFFLPNEVYYLAAFHHSSEEKPGNDRMLFVKSFDVNVLGILNFLEAIRRKSIQTRLFYAASSHVFGCAASEKQDERTPFTPVCVYGITKATGVQCCRYYRDMHSIFAAAGILYNHESVFRRLDFVSQKIIRGALEIKWGKRSKLILGDLGARIDWGYAPDYVDAMTKILNQQRADDFVVATGESHSVREFVEVAFGMVGIDWRQHVEEDPSLIVKQKKILVGDSTKLRALTGWKPSVSFEQMIGFLLHAYEQRLQNR